MGAVGEFKYLLFAEAADFCMRHTSVSSNVLNEISLSITEDRWLSFPPK